MDGQQKKTLKIIFFITGSLNVSCFILYTHFFLSYQEQSVRIKITFV